MALVCTENLSKQYGSTPVLSDVNLRIEAGRLVGFLGPNGAGKTTTIRILLGLLRATAGQAEIFGLPCWKAGRQIRDRIGYLPGDVHLYPHMTGQAVLNFYAGVRKRNCGTEISRLAELFELPLQRQVRRYSTGMRQKLGLIQALMHRPELLILDEPTSALDPLVRIKLFEELRNVVSEGRSVLFSSHSLDEVESLCDEVVIVRAGQIVEHQTIASLRQQALRRVQIDFQPGFEPTQPPAGLQLNSPSNAPPETSWQGVWAGEVAELVQWLAQQQLKELAIERPDLNDLFMRYYQE